MGPGGPPRPAPSYAGGPAAYRGEASSSSSSRPPPPQQQQQPQPSPPRGLDAGAPPFAIGPSLPVPIPPLHPQLESQQYPRDIYCSPGLYAMGPHDWSGASDPFHHAVIPISNSDMVAVPPTWPQQPQFVQQPTQPYYVHVGQPVPRIYPFWRLLEIRSELLSSPMTLEQLVMSLKPEHLEILVHQLEVGDMEMRKMVLDGFKQYAHWIMGNRQGHPVFEALLSSFHGKYDYDELEIIVNAAVTPSLVPRSDDGVASLKLLITAVSCWVFPRLSSLLVDSFLNERVMDDDRGDELIVHCFTTMPKNVTERLINHAIHTIHDKMLSRSGTKFLATCFRYAQDEQVPRFETTILANAVAMAQERSSKHFLLHLLDDYASMQFRKKLASNLMEDVLHLSLNCQGRYVMEHCFLNEENEVLNIALRACADLTQVDLQILVKQHASCNFVLPLHELLERGNTPFPEIARELAQKIEELPPNIRERDDLELLMSAVRSVLADNLANLGD